MNPREFPPAMAGNNLDTKTIRFLVLGTGELTSKQRAEIDHAFKLHQLNIRTALGGFLTRDLNLSDGTRVRIVSNSGQHAIIAWPEASPPRTALENLLFGAVASAAYGGGNDGTKFSCIAKFRGMEAVPAALKPNRRITDANGIKQHPGSLTWYSDAITVFDRPIVVSWYGRATRYGSLDIYGRQRQRACPPATFEKLYGVNIADNGFWDRALWYNAYKPAVWLNGVKRPTVKASDDSAVRVMSAALKEVDNKLWLYVVTHDTTLAVYKGLVGDPYKPAPIALEHVMNIDFKVDATGYSSTHANDPYGPQWSFDDPARPMWETLLQPLYFNKSADKLAGLVAVKSGSTSNVTAAGGTYSPVKLCQVDITAGTTTFTASHARYDSVVTQTPELRVKEFTRVTYAAVDWIADTLTICMMEHFTGNRWTTVTVLGEPSPMPNWSGLSATGNSSSGFPNTTVNAYTFSPATGFVLDGTLATVDSTTYSEYEATRTFTETYTELERTTTSQIRSRYRVYIVGGADIAAKDTGWLDVDEFYAREEENYTQNQAQRAYLDPVTGKYFSLSSSASSTINSEDATGWRTENFNDVYYWSASVQGGDLRHKSCIVVMEVNEEGTSSYSSTFDFGTNLTSAFTPVVTSSVNRYIGARLRLFTDGVDRFATAMHAVYVRSSTISSGFTTMGYHASVNVPFGSLSEWESQLTVDSTVLRPNYSALAPAAGYTGATFWQDNTNPVNTVGFPGAINVAFSADGQYGYFQLASVSPVGSVGLNDLEWIAKFWIGETSSFIDAYTTIPIGSWAIPGTITDNALTLTAPPRFELGAPLFIDNVPLQGAV